MEALQQIGAALLVFGLLGGVLYWARSRGFAVFNAKEGRRGGGRLLQSLERLSLTPHHSLHLVRIGGRVMLIAVSPGGCSVVDAGDSNAFTGDARPAR